MLRITIELLPDGDERSARHMATAKITNTGEFHDDSTIGNYRIWLSQWGRPCSKWKEGHLEGFLRKKCNGWVLLLLSLGATLADKLKGLRSDE